MIRKRAAVIIASGALFAGVLMAAPASANYAPQIPEGPVQAGSRVSLSIDGAQPGCRVTFSIRRILDGGQTRLVRSTQTPVNAQGEAESSLRAPAREGRYRLITRVDNFPGQTGCTPSTTVETVRVG